MRLRIQAVGVWGEASRCGGVSRRLAGGGPRVRRSARRCPTFGTYPAVKARTHLSLGFCAEVLSGRGSSGVGTTCWPPPEVPENLNRQIGNLGLSDHEEDQIVIFMQTLSDGYTPPNPIQ